MFNENQPNSNRDPLLFNAKAGDDLCRGQLVESYRDYLCSIAKTRIGQRLGARLSPSDIVQETMLAAWNEFESFRGDNSAQFTIWLRTILLRKLSRAVETHVHAGKRDIRRERMTGNAAMAGSLLSSIICDPFVAPDHSPSSIVSGQEQQENMLRLLEELPEDYRRVIEMRVFDQMRFEEIATEFNRTSTAVRLLWLRAVKKLRELHMGESDVET
jgi:RNA polymerase sigma-70 factor, ECF subfamily